VSSFLDLGVPLNQSKETALRADGDAPAAVPSAPVSDVCRFTLNENDVGGQCHPGTQVVGETSDTFLMPNMHHNRWHSVADKTTSITLSRTDASKPCFITFFKKINFNDCYWRLDMPAGATTASSKHFSGDTGDSASSFTVVYGHGGYSMGQSNPSNPLGRHQCGRIHFDDPNCITGSCDSSCGKGWCSCDRSPPSPPPPPPPPSPPPPLSSSPPGGFSQADVDAAREEGKWNVCDSTYIPMSMSMENLRLWGEVCCNPPTSRDRCAFFYQSV